MNRRIVAALALVSGVGCSSPASPGVEVLVKSGSLPAGVAARVGTADVSIDAVRRVASARGLTLVAARDLLVREALFAEGARARRLDEGWAARAALRGRLARAVLEKLRSKIYATPLARSELDEAIAERFAELDCPETFETYHVALLVPEGASADQRARARRAAEAIAHAAVGSRNTDEFRARANALDHAGFELRAERLLPVTADGRVVNRETEQHVGDFDKGFAAGASKLTRPNETSPVVESAYGLHVIMLIARYPAHALPRDEQVEKVRDSIYAVRGKDEYDALAAALRKSHAPAIDRAAETLLQRVPVGPGSAESRAEKAAPESPDDAAKN